jgi:xanthine/CO dehydrogenase XdhC/CoxF family maturation factor
VANDSGNDPVGLAKAQFDAAFRRLEAAQIRLQTLAANSSTDEAALQTARYAYDEARLLWLSSEAALRSAAIADSYHHYMSKFVVILQGNSHVAESIALLLRLRGFRATVLSRCPSDDDSNKPIEPPSAVIADFERTPVSEDTRAISRLRVTPSTRIVAMVPPALLNHVWDGFDAVLAKPASIDTIIQQGILGNGHE